MRERQPGRRGERPAFTLLELLVVIGIAAVIIALGAGTILQIIQGQDRKATEAIVRRLDQALQSQVRSTIDQAKELPVPNSVMWIAGNDPRRAKVIWQKLQIKRNFPMTYAEAMSPATYNGNTQITLPATLSNLPNDLPALVVFRNGLQNVPAAQYGVNPQAEMGALLNLTLAVTRRGSSFDAEQSLGAGSINDTNGDGVREIIDVWGQPLAYYRFPTDNADMDASKPGAASADPRRDPQDPEGLLLDTNWNNQTNYSQQQGVYWFEQLCHLVHDPTPQATWTPRAWYMTPTIVSAGRNRRLGLLLSPSPAPLGTASPNWGMYPDPNDINGAWDNIFSFSLK
jgi:prepilin-type N-terminal cleavage/methylation domain-containing protein